ncbi:MAG: N-acyl-L-amino acid amidohydrolase, partial [Shinella sp. 65-6]
VETSAFIASKLPAFGGIEISHPSGTSVVGRLRGARPGPTIAIRADFDALPIREETGLPYASRRDGVMHACGHDGHTAILLGTASVLSRLREEIAGEVRFLFENGEETPPGGAAGMIAGGAMDGVDRVIGLHLWSPYEIGTVQVNSRRVMAACDVFRIEVVGKGEFHAGRSVGVIPASASIGGGTNTFDAGVRDRIERRIGEIAAGICAAHGATCIYEYRRIYDAVVNDAPTAGIVRDVATGLFDPRGVGEMPPIMPGEDFSAFGHEAPSCFVLLGAGNAEKGITAAHHDAAFQIDEYALAMGVRLFTPAALKLLAETPPSRN